VIHFCSRLLLQASPMASNQRRRPPQQHRPCDHLLKPGLRRGVPKRRVPEEILPKHPTRRACARRWRASGSTWTWPSRSTGSFGRSLPRRSREGQLAARSQKPRTLSISCLASWTISCSGLMCQAGLL
jgi:hypothetical protein